MTADVIEFFIIQQSKPHVVFGISELVRCAFAGCRLSLTTSSAAMEAIKKHSAVVQQHSEVTGVQGTELSVFAARRL